MLLQDQTQKYNVEEESKRLMQKESGDRLSVQTNLAKMHKLVLKMGKSTSSKSLEELMHLVNQCIQKTNDQVY